MDVTFYERDGVLFVRIQRDASTVLDRVASDEDKLSYRGALEEFQAAKPAPEDVPVAKGKRGLR